MATVKEEAIKLQQNIDKVYEAGKKAEYDCFWDLYQDSGNRLDYSNAFAGLGWTAETFKPKHDMQPTSIYMMFRYAYNLSGDLVALLDERGVSLDTSQVTNGNYAFYGCAFTRLGVIDMRKCVRGNIALGHSTNLVTVDKIISSEENAYSGDFSRNLSALENIIFEGTIAGNGLDLHWSTKLTHDSLMSIINALKDYRGTDTWCTVTLGSENLAKLTQAELDMMTTKQWYYA